jgi:transcriptional regulator with XRE-family HTH domain
MIRTIFDKEMENPKFRSAFQIEYLKLTIGQDIAELRRKSKMTQLALAKKVKTSRLMIERYESGGCKNYNIVILQKIAQALGTELNVSLK